MWWKIYFWISIALAILGSLAVFSYPEEVTSVIIVEFIIYYIALAGLYAFVFSKHIFPTIFWKFYFWFYLLVELVYVAKVFIPYAPIQEYLGFLTSYDEASINLMIFSFLFEIPLLVALFKLSRKEYYADQEKKPLMVVEKNAPKWGMIQTALWGYNTVFTFILFLLSFYPTTGSGGEASDSLSGLALFAPLLLFWLLVVMQYKVYRWNWWRTTLVANSLLYSTIILYGLISPLPVEPTTGGFDIIGTIQIFILFLSLLVFGRDQFKISEPNKTVSP